MSVKRSSVGARGSATLGGGEVGGKVNGQELYSALAKRADSAFTAVDIALATGAGEPQVARALLGLAAEGVLQKVELGKYRATSVVELSEVEFLRAFARASKLDGTRMRDLQEIDRLKRNNDIMRARLLKAQAERDHYLAALNARGIDPGPLPQNEALERAESRAVLHTVPPPPPEPTEDESLAGEEPAHAADPSS